MAEQLPDPWIKWFNGRNVAIVHGIGTVIGLVLGVSMGFEEGGLGGALFFGVLGALVGVILSGFVSWIFNAELMAGFLLILAGLTILSLPFLFIALVVALWDVGN